MSAVIALHVDARAGFQRVSAAFGRMPAATDRAMARALRKLSTWMRRQVLRAASQAAGIPQVFFKRSIRYHTTIDKDTHGISGVSVWIGTNPIKAHRLGAVRWTKRMRGARVGRRSYPGSWSWGRGKTGPAVMYRGGGSRLPIFVEKEEPHQAVYARLSGLQDEAAARFERLLAQELNYALNHEAAR